MTGDEVAGLYRKAEDQLQQLIRELRLEIERHRIVEGIYEDALERYASGLDYGPEVAQGALRCGRRNLERSGEGGRGVVPGVL